MSAIRALGATFAFGEGEPLFTDLEFHLSSGWTGLVGPNGAGKTTLLRLITGDLRPSSGTLKVEPEGARVRLCPQRVDDLTDEVQAFAWAWDGVSRRLHGQLRLEPEALDRWDTLSPGERKRWQVGAALAEEPHVLLLDEPTNHLDVQAREWLLGALERFPGVGVVVSHDRALLDTLTTRTLRVDRGIATLWPGGYAEAKALWEAERQETLETRTRAKEARDRADRQLDDARRALQGAEAQRNTGRRMKNKYDSDARGLLADYRAARAEAHLGRKTAALRRQSERRTEALEEVEIDKELGRSVFVDWQPPHKPALAQLDLPELRAGEVRLGGPIRLTLGREDRVCIEGPNGAGKTTLLRALLGSLLIPTEQVLYVPQELTVAEGTATLEAIRALPPDARGRILSLVAALGLDPDGLRTTEAPSPGEARKLLIARGLASHAALVVLDEPTNHLDLPSVERLEEALGAYPGALVLVSHDADFARACTRTRWRLEGGALTVTDW